MSLAQRFLAGTGLALLLATGAAAQQSPNLETVVATVNGTEITLGELLITRAQLPQQYQQLPDETLFDGVLDQLVQQQLLSDELEAEPLRMKQALVNETRALRAGEVIAALSESVLTDERLEALYNERFVSAEPQPEFDASHILVETEEEAQAIIEELEAGADFAELAQEKSTGPSGPSGGALGWFGLGAMVPSFEKAVVAMEKGTVSGPVKSPFGWHVIKLNDLRDKVAPALGDVRDELAAEIAEKAVEDHIAELKSSADVVRAEGISPEVISQLDLLD